MSRPSRPPAPLSFHALLLGSLLAASASHAADFTVDVLDDPVPDGCTPGSCSLREAIGQANALSGKDRILLPATPTPITLTIAGENENSNATGDLDILDEVEIIGAGAAATVIKQTVGDRVMHVRGPHISVLRGFTLEGGRTNDVGGGLYQEFSVLALADIVFRDNRAQHGGGAAFEPLTGIYQGVEVTLRYVAFLGNEAVGDGGGALLVMGNPDSAFADLRDVRFEDNLAGIRGGGLRVQAPSGSSLDLTLVRTDFLRNSAEVGGGIHMPSPTVDSEYGLGLTLYESTLANNTAVVAGGGLHVGYGAYIRQSTFSGNAVLSGSLVSGGGGAIAVPGAVALPGVSLILSRSTLSDNDAARGGSVWVQGRRVLINHTTIARSGAPQAGSIGTALLFEGSTDRLEVSNSIVSGDCAFDAATVPTVATGNVESPGSTCRFDTAASSQANRLSQSATALGLGPLAYNGGRTETHMLLPGSAARDAGVLQACEFEDQRGFFLAEPMCDAGAVEADGLQPALLRDGFEG